MMHELFMSPFFGIGLSIAAFWVGTWIRKKTGLVLCNPLVLAIVIVSGVLLIFKIPYEEYNEGGALINMFLAPATACLAVSIYTRAELLKKNWLPIVVGASCGSLASMGSVLLMCKLFGMDEAMTVSLIPKSVTTPIAVSVAEGHGGMVPITVVAVIFTGILGSIFAPTLIRLFRVNDPMIAGISIGACSHAVGTSKAIELGETEGAMSGLAIGVCGIRTVFDDFAALKLAAPCGQKLRHGHKNYSADVRTAQRQTTAARGAKWGRAWRKWEKGQIGSKWM